MESKNPRSLSIGPHKFYCKPSIKRDGVEGMLALRDGRLTFSTKQQAVFDVPVSAITRVRFTLLRLHMIIKTADDTYKLAVIVPEKRSTLADIAFVFSALDTAWFVDSTVPDRKIANAIRSEWYGAWHQLAVRVNRPRPEMYWALESLMFMALLTLGMLGVIFVGSFVYVLVHYAQTGTL